MNYWYICGQTTVFSFVDCKSKYYFVMTVREKSANFDFVGGDKTVFFLLGISEQDRVTSPPPQVKEGQG